MEMKRNWPLILVSLISVHTFAADQFSVKESGDNLELVTPWGTKTLVGDIGFKNNGNYRIEIPLEDLRPVFPSKPTPAEAEEKPDEPPKKKLTKKEPKASEASEDDDDDSTDEPEEPKAKQPNKDRQPQSIPQIASPLTVEYDDTDKLVLEANHFYNQGRYFEATEDVEEILRKKPDYVRGWIMKGSLMYVQNQKDIAKKAWEKAQTLEPENAQVKSLLERYR